ncbi:uncharacterized protein LOC134195853 isoform X2 [Corticium candelabrum]|uniref:uncharacterized protein LOC134195853 isoform X2 n=1 Tax=Corticium candelabrum TaxID=121492 RepID=UPI002E2731FA|nr:uncharacterized protein LOC134195853 isoform X2 [Corticium candelabrum]
MGTTMHNYFGFYVYDKYRVRIRGNWNKGYFKDTNNDQNRWTKWTAFVLPHDMHDHDKDGLPNADTQSFHTNGIDWLWPREAAYAALRFGSCHGTGIGIPDSTWYTFPTVKEITTTLIPLIDVNIPLARTFDISNVREWSGDVDYGGIAFVNGRYTPTALVVGNNSRLCYDPWYTTEAFMINHEKQYEFSIWILSTGSDLTNYFGFFAYDKNNNIIKEGSMNNPYFKSAKVNQTKWQRWNGFILPSYTERSKQDPNNPMTNVPKHFTNGIAWIWPSNARYAKLRFGTCMDSGDRTGSTYYALPQLIMSDLRM